MCYLKPSQILQLFCLSSFLYCGVTQNISFAQSPVGRWKGEWSSDSTGHHGPMRANVRAKSNGTYSALYTGRFLAVIPFVYRADLIPTDSNNANFVTTKSLGPLLGSYTMQTHFNGPTMQANFSAGKDQGRVKMSRVTR